MIRLIRVSKNYAMPGRPPIRVLSGVSLSIPTSRRVAVLGKRRSGKSTLMRLLLGSIRPDEGVIQCGVKLSPPLGFHKSLHPEMTGLENIMFVARLYGEPWQELVGAVDAMTGLGRTLEHRVLTYLPAEKTAVAYALTLAVRFDCYLADDSVVPPARPIRRKFAPLVEERLRHAGLIFCTSKATLAREYCDVGLVLSNETLVAFDDIDEAVAFYESLS